MTTPFITGTDTRVGKPELATLLTWFLHECGVPVAALKPLCSGGHAAAVALWTRGGIASGLVSLPVRYLLSPVEVVSLKDLEQIPQLLAAFASSLQAGEQFKVRI